MEVGTASLDFNHADAPFRWRKKMANKIEPPRYALVEVEGGFVVEPFDRSRHISPKWGWAGANVHLFSDRRDVEHLREQILN